MRIGIIGLGSIGKTHANCLRELGIDKIIALRTKKGTIKNLPEELNFITEVFSSEDFYSYDFAGIIISNPTSLHVETMKKPLEKKIPIFVEKPISASLEQIEDIKYHNTSNVIVGYCLRYNEIINYVKNFIDSGKLGIIYKAKLYCGQYLPSWHSYSDYRNEYYSQKILGGGALRTLSHEIDLIHYFFGKVKNLIANIEQISSLEIDVDDNVNILCKMAKKISLNIELDYLNPISTRSGIIFGSNGIIEYSFSELKVIHTKLDGTSDLIYDGKNYNPNKMYLDQMYDFINFIKFGGNIRCNFQDGINVMKVIKTAEDSVIHKSWQEVKYD